MRLRVFLWLSCASLATVQTTVSALAETRAECLAKVDADFADWKIHDEAAEKLKAEIRTDEHDLNRNEYEIDRDLYGVAEAQAHLDAVTLRDQLKDQAEDAKDDAFRRDKQNSFANARKDCEKK